MIPVIALVGNDASWAQIAREPGIERHCPDSLQALVQDEGGVDATLASGRRLRAPGQW